jgi:hypothetical protein
LSIRRRAGGRRITTNGGGHEHVRSVTTENVGEILQRLYDSEINVQLGWNWDGGVDYRIGSRSPDIWSAFESSPVQGTGSRDVVAAVQQLVDTILARAPTSAFAAWWRGGALVAAEAPVGRQ